MDKIIARQTKEIDLKDLEIGSIQPRKFFNETTLKELASSLKEKGTLQPVIIRPKGEKYEVIVGARRFRAAQIAGFSSVPAYILKDINDSEALELALTENIQREDLTPLEEAWAILRLMKDHDYTVKDMCTKLGKAEHFVRLRLMLLQLPEPILKYVAEGKLAMESASYLTRFESPENQIKATEEILEHTLSVAQTKEMVLRKAETIRWRKISKRQEIADKKVILQLGVAERLLNNLNFEKLPFTNRENLRYTLLKFKEQIEKIIQKMEEMD